MLYNEERPQTFDDMVGQSHIIEGIRRQAKENKWFHVYIFAGQFGSGKTTMGRIIELTANCEHKDENGNPCLECDSCKAILSGDTTDVMEIDAASNNGVDSIRDLKESVGYMPLSLPYKVYIIDEVQMLSKGAFNALLKILEEPPEYAIFILCTTELKSIPVTVRSRSATYIFEQIAFDDIFNRLKLVAEKYYYNISTEALTLIAKNAQGAMRNAYTLLEQVIVGANSRVEAADVQRILGICEPSYMFKLLKSIIEAKQAECIMLVEQAVTKGKDLSLLINDLLDIVADAVVAKSASLDIIHETEQYKELLSELLNVTYVEQLCQIAEGLMNIRIEMRQCPSNTTVIVGIIRITTTSINASILSRLEEVEKFINEGGKPSNNYSLTENIEEKSIQDNEVYENKQFDSEQITDMERSNEKPADNNLETDQIKESVNESCTNDEGTKEDNISLCDTDNHEGEEFSENESVDGFDIFSIIDDFNTTNIQDTVIQNIPGDSKLAETDTITNSLKQSRLEEKLREMFIDDQIFLTALTGCIRKMIDGKLALITPLHPVRDIIDAYLKAANVNDIYVEHDESISLN